MMLSEILIAKVDQKILRFLAKYSDKEFHEREIVRRVGVASGSANRALNELFTCGAIKRRQEFRMLFYSIDSSNPAIREFKILVNILLIEPLVEELKEMSSRLILYGSCAQGTDNSKSDLDIFIVTGNRTAVLTVIENYTLPKGFADIHIQAVIKNPSDILRAGESEQVFLNEVEKGITLWESSAIES
jgi:predicted nucleotidyltransferase